MPASKLKMAKVVLFDPFHTGSHAAFTVRLQAGVAADWHIYTLPGRHWKWRMRGAAVHFADAFERDGPPAPDLIVTTSMLSLTDLKALAPTLAPAPSLLYFHENQFEYPDRLQAARDNHFGFTQLVSARAATRCAFNSRYNLESFLDAAQVLLRALPDAVPKNWVEEIHRKSCVLPIPLALSDLDETAFAPPATHDPRGPLILWNHRWEHDKDPESFFAALDALTARGRPFRLAVAGPRNARWPACFDDAKHRFSERLEQFGPCSSRAEYESLLLKADVAVSTARHEFFGIAMLEAIHFGAFVLVPDRLAYPEIFPPEHRYMPGTLTDRLEACIADWQQGRPLRADRRRVTAPYGRPALEGFAQVIEALTARADNSAAP